MKYNHTDELFSGQRAAALAGISDSRLGVWKFRGVFAGERGDCYTGRDVRRLALLRRLRDLGLSFRTARRALASADAVADWTDSLLVVTDAGGRVVHHDSWERIRPSGPKASSPLIVLSLHDLSAEPSVSSGVGPAAARREAAPGAGTPPVTRSDGAEARVA